MTKRKLIESDNCKNALDIKIIIKNIYTAYLLDFISKNKPDSLATLSSEKIENFKIQWEFNKQFFKDILKEYNLNNEDLKTLLIWHKKYMDICNFDEHGNDFFYHLLVNKHPNILNLWKLFVDNELAPYFNDDVKNVNGLKMLCKIAPKNPIYQEILDYITLHLCQKTIAANSALDINKIIHNNGNSLLHYAAIIGSKSTCKYLISLGADATLLNHEGLTAQVLFAKKILRLKPYVDHTYNMDYLQTLSNQEVTPLVLQPPISQNSGEEDNNNSCNFADLDNFYPDNSYMPIMGVSFSPI
jgi:hypothetical protein